MRFYTSLLSSALALSATLFATQSAEAQTRTAVTTMASSNAGAEALSAPVPSAQQNDDDVEEKKNPMGWAGIGVKVGVAATTVGKGSIMGQQGRIDGRTGVHIAVPINLGGDGASFTFEPYLSRSSVSHDTKDQAGVVTGSESVGLNAYGIYLGPTFNIHVSRAAYVGFGLGIKGAYVHNPAFDYAVDLYGRVPIHGTYYVSKTVALVAEVGMGYGASVFVDKPQIAVDTVTRSVRNTRDDPQFGLAMTWDATFGVRLP